MSIETKEIMCPGCLGTGTSEELDHDDESVSACFYRDIDCRKCNGRGYIIVSKEVPNGKTRD